MGTKKSRHLYGCLDLIGHTSLGSVCCVLVALCVCVSTPSFVRAAGSRRHPPSSVPPSCMSHSLPWPFMQACVAPPKTTRPVPVLLFPCIHLPFLSFSPVPSQLSLSPSISELLVNVPCPTTASHIIGPYWRKWCHDIGWLGCHVRKTIPVPGPGPSCPIVLSPTEARSHPCVCGFPPPRIPGP